MFLNLYKGITTESPFPGKHYVYNESGKHVGVAARAGTKKWCAKPADWQERTKENRNGGNRRTVFGHFPTMRDAAYALVRYNESGDEKWLRMYENNS